MRVIAEPGRYFAETSSTLMTVVIGQRDRPQKDGSTHKDYWLTDGLYGSFNWWAGGSAARRGRRGGG